MSTSQEVFELRKSGALDEAYSIALELISKAPSNQWNYKALAWCLVDLINRSADQNDYEMSKRYLAQLEALQISDDEILLRALKKARIAVVAEKKIIIQANAQSKLGNRQEAIRLFKEALLQYPEDVELNEQYAWELQKEAKIIFSEVKIDLLKAKRLLADYLKLKNERPSKVHSLFLNYAIKITDNEEFKLIFFIKLWDLYNLREEDYVPFEKDGKSYPSIAEKSIQQCAKYIFEKKLTQEVDYILPFLNKCIEKCEGNIWLPYYKAKILHLANRNDEAFEFTVPVVRQKMDDFWAWELLGELFLESALEKTISCYCKALLCNNENKFTVNLRLKLADILIEKKLWCEAKFEIDTIIKTKESEGAKIKESLKSYQQQEWYQNAISTENNNHFYDLHKQIAEDLIFSNLQWYDGCVGDTFTTKEKPDKLRRKMLIKTPAGLLDIVVSDKKFAATNIANFGDGILVKGEFDKENRFQVYLIEKREAAIAWDILPEQIGIIYNIKKEKEIAHFIINKTTQGVVSLKLLNEKIELGSAVKMKLIKAKNGFKEYFIALTGSVTQEKPIEDLFRSFAGYVSISNRVGFADDVYIENRLIEELKIVDSDYVEGTAILNFNKKKYNWGWKAIKIMKSKLNDESAHY